MRLPAVSAARGRLTLASVCCGERGSAGAGGPPHPRAPRPRALLSLPQGPPLRAGHGHRPSAGGHGCAILQPGLAHTRSPRRPRRPQRHCGWGSSSRVPPTLVFAVHVSHTHAGDTCASAHHVSPHTTGDFVAGPWRGHKSVRSLLQEEWIREGPERPGGGTRVLGLQAAPPLTGEGQGVCPG